MNNYTTARLPLRQSENSELLRQRIEAPVELKAEPKKSSKKTPPAKK